MGDNSLVKFGSITAEILLIWTNVAVTFVDWTKVTVTVDICWNLPLQFAQNGEGNSRGIPDMDECRQDKCLLEANC